MAGAVKSASRDNGADDDGRAIRVVDETIAAAVRLRASDIHLEPLGQRLRVRCRVDGSLREMASHPKEIEAMVISRTKLMAGISVAERRLPQDGRIQVNHDGRRLDLRVSTVPTVHGESVVMRVLDRANLGVGLDDLGLFPDDREELERLVNLPDGMVLVTGPTGSGKTTTLYSCLQHLNRGDRKIITVEDPVEYSLTGINQVAVKPEAGMTFATALRAMLRQAPNVIMVGEIRDRETAEIAIHAALTGHLVLSTLHTNDAPGAVTRLRDLGIRPFLIAASLRAVVAQRLVRRVCVSCARSAEASERERRLLAGEAASGGLAGLRHGAGCLACDGTGFRGRLGLYEFFVINDDGRRQIHAEASAERLRRTISGWRSLRSDGLRKVIAGLTTAAEVVCMASGEVS
ncbi:MAG: type II/IV secretion system protein [Verrucomicrobia bacterium]|nr:type II/IV secretion system protein [Verrucomicrobiota bacterium]